MKKLLILFLALTFVGGLAFGGPINITLDASSTLKWRITGDLMDNSATFGLVPRFIKTPTVSQTADFEAAPAEIALGLSVADANKVTIVKAESLIDTTAIAPLFAEDAFDDAFHYIEFPNVVPGMLGVMLHKAGTLSTDVTSKASTISVPNVVVTIVPIKDATVKIGIALQSEPLLWKYDPDTTITTDTVKTTQIGTYTNFAASLYASYKLMIGEKDSVTFALGTVFDTAYTAGVVTSAATLDPSTVAADAYYEESYMTYVIADNPVATDGEKWGVATLPFGVTVGLAMGDLKANVKAQLRLTQGKDPLNVDTAGDPRAWGVPMYAKVDASYKLVVGDMTITPAVNFQYSSDYWKYWYDADPDVAAWAYKGEVSGAEFIGRPMSFGLSVPVVGIAKMVDVTLFGSAGLGDGEFAYGAYGTTAGMAATTWVDFLDAKTTADDKHVAADAMAYKVGLTVTAKPVAEVMVKNELTYNHDGLGFVGQSSGTKWGSYLNRIKDVVTGEYYLKVADATAATFYCILTFQNDTFNYSDGINGTATTLVDYDTPELASVDNAGKTTLGYELGVYVKVKY